MKAIGWGFVGLRRKKDFDVDAEGAFNPLYVLLAAFIGLAIFIGILMFAVQIAIS
nr:DUF2970 domain-containing protein [Telluria aromaticivorans]